jgi:hypothetical protein
MDGSGGKMQRRFGDVYSCCVVVVFRVAFACNFHRCCSCLDRHLQVVFSQRHCCGDEYEMPNTSQSTKRYVLESQLLLFSSAERCVVCRCSRCYSHY